MLYGSETWHLRETEKAVSRRTERAMVRSMCVVKLVDRKKMEDLMEMLGLKETFNRMAKANGVRWSSSCGWASSSDGLDVDGVDFKPASGVIIQDQQTLYSFWSTM